MDNEFILKIKNYDNLDDIQEELERFSYYYNEKRYLHYGELNKIDPKNRYMKPIDSIKYLHLVQYSYWVVQNASHPYIS